jgi:hypothetical protein
MFSWRHRFGVKNRARHNQRFILTRTNKILALAPVAYYQLAESSGTTATDSSGNGYNGTYINAVPGGTGNGDGQTGATFDGTGDYIDISPMSAAFDGAHGTVLVWGKTAAWTDASVRYLVRIAASTNHLVFIMKTATDNTLNFRRQAGVANAKSIGDTSLAGSSAYFCAALTWDTAADELKAYINGVQVGTTQTGLAAFVGAPAATTTAIGALGTTGANSWSGGLAHVAIWNTALTPAQILTLATP